MTRAHLMPGVEALRLSESSLKCTVVDDVYATMRDGTARVTELERISCPVLVVWGEKDRVLPLDKHGPHFREGIPGVEFRVLPGLGHVPMWDDAALLSATIGDFAAAAAASTNGHASRAALRAPD
jgi:pimeloyl-ACP methyl ester carboxylesterase